jgi:hypothetical protein
VAAVRAEQKARITAKKAAKTDPATPAKTTATQPASTANVANDPYGLSALNTDYYSSPEFLNAINTSAATQPVQTQSAVSPASTVNYGNAGLPATQASVVEAALPSAAQPSAANPYGLPPEAAAELAAFDLPTWQAEQQRRGEIVSSRDAAALAAARGTGISNIDMYSNASVGDDIIPGTNANILAGLGMYDPKYEAVMRTYGSSNDQKNPNDVTERSTFAVDPTASYRLVDNKTGAVIASSSNPTNIRSLVDSANELSASKGKNANWSIQVSSPSPAGNPTDQQWNTIAEDKPDSDLADIGKVLGTALPIAVSLIPGLQFAGPLLSSVLAGGAGAAMAGRDPIKGALTAGLTAGGTQFLGPVIQGAGIGLDAANAIGTGIGATAGGLATGQNLKNSLLSGAAAGGLSYLGGQVFKPEGNSLVDEWAKSQGIYDVASFEPLPLADGFPSSLANFEAPSIVAPPRSSDLTASVFQTPTNFAVSNTPTNFGISNWSLPPTTALPATGVSPAISPNIIPRVGDLAYGSTQAATRGLDDLLADISSTAASNAATAGLSSSGFDGLGASSPPPTPSSPITVTGTGLPAPTPTGFNAGALSNLLPAPRYSGDGPTTSNPIVVTGANDVPAVEDRSPFAVNPVVPTTSNPIVVTGANDVPAVEDRAPFAVNPVVPTPSEPIVVTGAKDVPAVEDRAPFAVNPIVPTPSEPIVVTGAKDVPALNEDKPLAVNLDVGSTLATVDNNPDITEAKKKSDLDKALAAIKAAGVLLPLLGGNGNGSGAAGTIPGGLGGLNPIFTSKLPTNPTNIPGGVGTAANFAARPMGEQDWLTYGQRPEQSFFNYVPQQPKAMAHGGRTDFAVHGAGTGRSDSIPAVLSDGEYVMDAETVALLGDGSSKAGAKKLDDLRVKVRKQKGQKLAQGRFSANAKNPEAYLSGGRI